MTAAAFKAAYSDWRIVKGRKVVQVVFELPLESADEAYQVLGGMPIAANEHWCAIARLEVHSRQDRSGNDAQPEPEVTPTPKPPVRADGAKKSPAQIAGFLCTQTPFHKFLQERFGDSWHKCEMKGLEGKVISIATAAAVVRDLCEVDSRADIKPDNAEWSALLLAYRLWEKHPELEDLEPVA